MKAKYYIAYGSNLNIKQMKYRCRGARIAGTGFIDGYHLIFRGSKTGSYLTIEQKAGLRVPVAIWRVTAEDEKSLDRYEGFPTFYYKKELELDVSECVTGKTRKLKCFVYIMHEDRPVGLPSEFYVRTCEIGYDDFGFDKGILSRAIFDTMEEMQYE